jgi:single stranded DNA-binding protein
MATVFETRLIGNIGRDATTREMERGVVAINFPVAHNKNWKDKKSGTTKTKTTWVNCTIWKRDGANMRIMDYLTKGTLVELVGTPVAKGYLQDDNTIRTEIRLNVSKTNILRPCKTNEHAGGFDDSDEFDEDNDSFSDDLEFSFDDL